MLVAGAGVGLMVIGAIITRWGAHALQRDPMKEMSYRVILGAATFLLGFVVLVIGVALLIFQ